MPLPLAPLIFIVLPLFEIAGFVIVGSQIGVLATIGLIIASSILGAVLLRVQGFGILRRLRQTVDRGGEPGRDLVHGFMVMLAGFLLVLPGFLTDIVGLILFVPPVRDAAWRFLKRRLHVVDISSFRRGTRSDDIIDLDDDEFTRDSGEPRNRPSIDHDPRF